MKSGCCLLFCCAGQIQQRCDATAAAEGCTNFPARGINLLNRNMEKKSVSTEGRLRASFLERVSARQAAAHVVLAPFSELC